MVVSSCEYDNRKENSIKMTFRRHSLFQFSPILPQDNMALLEDLEPTFSFCRLFGFPLATSSGSGKLVVSRWFPIYFAVSILLGMCPGLIMNLKCVLDLGGLWVLLQFLLYSWEGSSITFRCSIGSLMSKYALAKLDYDIYMISYGLSYVYW